MGKRLKSDNNRGFYQGIYRIKNKHKYIGSKAPMMRSGWEFKLASFFDSSANVKAWDSEPENIVIHYKTPDGKTHRYHPDFYVEMYDNDKILKHFLVEIKPFAQSPWHCKPKEPLRKTTKAWNRYMEMCKTHITNQLKWEAAKAWCEEHNLTFLVLTEKELGIKL